MSWQLENQYGPVTVTGQGIVGSRSAARPTIANGGRQTFDVAVPAGSSRLDVAIGDPSDQGADLDLSVYRDGVLVAQDADADSEESVSIPNPAASTYQVVVDGFDVPAGTTEYDYVDVYFAPSLGSLTASGPVTLANDANATLTGSLTANARPASGRQLFAELTLVDDEDAPVGRAQVVVTSVAAP